MPKQRAREMEICPGFLHEMEVIPGSGRKVQFGIPVYLRCVRCGTERTDVYAVTGKRISQKYWRPDEYQELLQDVRLDNKEQRRVRAFKAMRANL